ncbi:hypothetical protein ACF0H5_013047 [Mactra antiquata]
MHLYLLLGHDALWYGLDSGCEYLRDVFSRAPTQAQWSVNQQEDQPVTDQDQSEETKSVEASAGPEIVVDEIDTAGPIDKHLNC